MGKLTQDELVELSGEVMSLIAEIKKVKGEDSPGGTKISKREARYLLRLILRLAAKVAIDVLDD